MAANRPARSWAPIILTGALAIAILSTGGAALASGGGSAEEPVTIQARAASFSVQSSGQPSRDVSATPAPAVATAIAVRAEGGTTTLTGGAPAAPSVTSKSETSSASAQGSVVTNKELAAATPTP